jgi:hypothetical protein
MRFGLLILPLALVAGPALAQTKPAPAQTTDTVAISRVLNDPATADKLARMMQVMSKAFLNLPVGELEAAAEGRAVTPADRNRTLRQVGRGDNPNFEQDLQAELTGSRATLQASMKALSAALPSMMKGLNDAGREMEKAVENMPRPNYPKR